jgi:putative ABC transport system permease protein
VLKLSVGWLQLKREKSRLAVAILGITFAAILVFMQIGFREAMLDSAVRYHHHWIYEIALVSPEAASLIKPHTFTRRRLHQARAVEGVAAVSAVHTLLVRWKRPDTGNTRDIFVLGIDPDQEVIDLPEVNRQRHLLKLQDAYLFDRHSRPEFGAVPGTFAEHGRVTFELNNLTIHVRGLFTLGSSFGIDGSLISSEENILRVNPRRSRGEVDIGLVRLKPGADADAVAERLRNYLPGDVEVYTRPAFIQRELAYWKDSTPIGYVFNFGIVVGLVVGAVIVYQILHADVSDHLPQYATLKAMGYSNLSLAAIVGQQAFVLAVLGYSLGAGVSLYLYRVVGEATLIALAMSPGRAATVLGLTVAMCLVSGLMALRRVWTTDPAEVF